MKITEILLEVLIRLMAVVYLFQCMPTIYGYDIDKFIVTVAFSYLVFMQGIHNLVELNDYRRNKKSPE